MPYLHNSSDYPPSHTLSIKLDPIPTQTALLILNEINIDAPRDWYNPETTTINPSGLLERVAIPINARTAKNHCQRLSKLASCFGTHLDLPISRIKDLMLAGYFADVGLAKLDQEIPLSPQKLQPHQRGILETHVIEGYNILRDSPYFAGIQGIVLCHHEKMDGTGYPHRIKSSHIPCIAQQFQVCDIWAAMTSKRTYRPAIEYHQACQYLINEVALGWRSGDVVNSFIQMIKGLVNESPSLVLGDLYQESSQ